MIKHCNACNSEFKFTANDVYGDNSGELVVMCPDCEYENGFTENEEVELLIDKIEELDWAVKLYKNEVGKYELELEIYSPAGQDCVKYVCGVDIHDLIEDIYAAYDAFDCSYETYLWLDDTGHGANGAPYDMKELYEDMEWLKSKLLELYDELHKWWDNM